MPFLRNLPGNVLKVPGRIRRSLRASLADGVYGSGVLGLVDTSLMPFGIALNATPTQIAQLGSLPNLIAALLQSQAHSLTEWFDSRKRTLLFLYLVHAAAIGLAAFINFFRFGGPMSLIGISIFYIGSGSLMGPIWGSLLCEYLPLTKRGRYFGWRMRILGPIVIATSLLAGWVLQLFGKNNLYGFALIFSLACLLRLLSWKKVREMYEPDHAWFFHERRVRLRLTPEVRRNFFWFVLFGSFMMGGAQIIGPLQSVYLLKDLRVNYFTYSLLVAASNGAMFFMMATWGQHADVLGNLRVIRLVASLMPVIPLLWLFSANPSYLFAIQMLGGACWAGYNLCITNFVYDAVPASDRIRATALFNTANSFATYVGAMLGSGLIGILPPLHGYPYLSLCVVSAAVRFIGAAFILPRVTEVRHVQQVRTLDLFHSVIGLKPIPGIQPSALRRLLVRSTGRVLRKDVTV